MTALQLFALIGAATALRPLFGVLLVVWRSKRMALGAKPDAAPGPDAVQGRDYDHAGFLDVDLLKRALPHGRHAFYVCGPDPMMQALIPALRDRGADEAEIHRESFGPPTAAPKPLAPTSAGPGPCIGFLRSGRVLDWTGQDASLLHDAERHAVQVDSGCRKGGCGLRETRLISGRVTSAPAPDRDIAPGRCPLCIAAPVAAWELDA